MRVWTALANERNQRNLQGFRKRFVRCYLRILKFWKHCGNFRSQKGRADWPTQILPRTVQRAPRPAPVLLPRQVIEVKSNQLQSSCPFLAFKCVQSTLVVGMMSIVRELTNGTMADIPHIELAGNQIAPRLIVYQ